MRLYLIILLFKFGIEKRLGGFKRVEYDKGALIMEKALKSAESIYIQVIKLLIQL